MEHVTGTQGARTWSIGGFVYKGKFDQVLYKFFNDMGNINGLDMLLFSVNQEAIQEVYKFLEEKGLIE